MPILEERIREVRQETIEVEKQLKKLRDRESAPASLEKFDSLIKRLEELGLEFQELTWAWRLKNLLQQYPSLV